MDRLSARGRVFAKTLWVIILVLIAIGVGYFLRGACAPQRHVDESWSVAQAPPAAAKEKPQIWTCSMHPQIRLPKPGKCPICAMDLIPAGTDETDTSGDARIFTTSPAAKALMEIQTSPAERRYVTAEIRMVGKMDYDETKLGYITAWVPGRLDRLYVDYTGVEVKQGDHDVHLQP